MSSPAMKAIKDMLGLLRLKAFDVSTEEGRSQERHRRIAWTTVTAGVAKVIAAAVMFISVPLTLGYLGPERFGLWMTISAAIAMLGFADFGLGNGILNAISHANGRSDKAAIHQFVSNGFIALTAIAGVMTLVFIAAYGHVPWPALFNVRSAAAVLESGPVTFILAICFFATLPLGVTQKIQLGLQRGHWGYMWEAVGSIMGLIGIVIATQLQAGLQWIALSMAGLPLLSRAVNTFLFFGYQAESLRPRFAHFDFAVIKRLIRTGIMFFVLQLAVIIGFQSDNIIIARILGAEAVAGYDVALKLATVPAMFIGLIVAAQWPAYGEASARGDTDWIRRTFARTIRLGLSIAIPFACILFVWGDVIIRIWAGDQVVPSVALLGGMSVWSVLVVLGSVIAALLNGLHIVKFQAVSALLMATANILISIYLVNKIGVLGAILGTIVSYTILTLFPCSYYIRRHISEFQTASSKQSEKTDQ